jgi:zinc/manganese transport system substrate-binding protein
VRAFALALIAAVAVGLPACGDDGGESTTVTATTGIMADITRQVAGGDAEVVQVIPEGASPHDFSLSAMDRARIEDSILLVHNGAGLEEGIQTEDIDVPQFALTDHAGDLRPFLDAGEHGEQPSGEDAAEEEGEGGDPHVWMDPTRLAAALPGLAEALAEADPDHAAGYRNRAEEFAAELGDLDAELRRALSVIPADDRELVTSHDALGYFAARYDFQVVATPFPASGPEAEPSAKAIREVEEAIRDAAVPTVFSEEEDDPEVLRQIADRTGVQVVDDLLVESPGSTGSYVEMLRHDAELIRQALVSSPFD